tara:strand:- start:69 stop:896 length:828 start_codon:yes stop_codon:yes gene_type:complete
MRILVTGASGFIGKNLVKSLRSQGHSVFTLDRISNEWDTTLCMDVKQINKLASPPELIYHLAADIRVQESFNIPTQYIDNNVMGTQYILDYAYKVGSKVVYAGSASRHTNPYLSPYALSKYMGEELCKMYKQTYNLDVEIARFYNVYGPGEHLHPTESSVVGIWRYNIANNLPLNVVGDGEQKRDFIHVEDICEGLSKIGLGKESHKDAWELGTGTMTNINDLGCMFHEKFGINLNYIDDQPGNVRESVVLNYDMSERLQWVPKHRIIDYITSLT